MKFLLEWELESNLVLTWRRNIFMSSLPYEINKQSLERVGSPDPWLWSTFDSYFLKALFQRCLRTSEGIMKISGKFHKFFLRDRVELCNLYTTQF